MSAAYPWGFADESMGLSGGQWTFIIECMRNDRITPSQFQKMMKNYAITRAFIAIVHHPVVDGQLLRGWHHVGYALIQEVCCKTHRTNSDPYTLYQTR